MKATPQTMGPLPHRLASSSGELFLTQYVGIYMAKLTKWTGYLLTVQAVTAGAVTLCVRNYALETTSNVPYGMHTHNLNDLDCGHKPRLPLLPLLPLVTNAFVLRCASRAACIYFPSVRQSQFAVCHKIWPYRRDALAANLPKK